MKFAARICVFLLVTLTLCAGSIAQSRRSHGGSAAATATAAETQIRDRLNAWTVGLAGGLLEGAPIHFATDIARVVSDGGQVQVLPIVTRGPTENVNDLLYLKGVDAAIINSDALEEYKSQVPQIQQRITYIISLFPSELHIFVRPEIRSLADLAGKKVNFNTQGTAAAYSGPLIFSRLGLDVDKMFIPHPVALEQMKHGEHFGARDDRFSDQSMKPANAIRHGAFFFEALEEREDSREVMLRDALVILHRGGLTDG